MRPHDVGSQEDKLREKIFRIRRLAAMPHVAWRLVEALTDEKTTVKALAEIIETDQALTSKVLSLANSAYYGFSEPVTTIQRAAVLIGFQELQILALSTGLSENFDIRQAPPALDGEALWLHCLAVSWLGRTLAEVAGYPSPAEVMVAGLLHDLGKLVLITHLQKELPPLLERLEQGIPYYQAEEESGLPHTTIGMWLGRRWDLPPVHLEAIEHHHLPQGDLPFFDCTYLVFLADRLAKQMGFGLVHPARPVAAGGHLERVNLTPAVLKQVVQRARLEMPSNLEKMRFLLSRDQGDD